MTVAVKADHLFREGEMRMSEVLLPFGRVGLADNGAVVFAENQ